MTVEVGLLPLVQAILGSVRVLLMMIVGPLFSHPAISLRIRLGLALTIAWAIGPVASGMGIGAEQGGLSVGALALAVLSEVVIGLAIGLGAGLVFAGILQLGEFMAVQGLGAARSIDPATGVSTLAISTALNTFAMLVFLVIGGHHELIRGLALSFEVYPIGGGAPDGAVLLEVARLGSVVWEVAFRLAAPLTVAIFVQNVATGVLGRAMPQLNLLLVNLPMHVGMLFLLIGLGANDYLDAFARMLGAWPSRVFDVLLGGVHGG